MELSLESDAEALWQDALDLLAARELPESLLAMLRNCEPAGLSDGTLELRTSMRLVVKNVGKIQPLVEECVSQAAFEPTKVVVTIAQATAAGEHPRGSTMTRV